MEKAKAKVGMTWEGNDIYYPQASGAQQGDSHSLEGIDIYYPGLSFSERLCPKCCFVLGLLLFPVGFV